MGDGCAWQAAGPSTGLEARFKATQDLDPYCPDPSSVTFYFGKLFSLSLSVSWRYSYPCLMALLEGLKEVRGTNAGRRVWFTKMLHGC